MPHEFDRSNLSLFIFLSVFSSLSYLLNQFNADISNWDVSKVTLFEEMFWGATAFNQDISGWDLSSGELLCVCVCVCACLGWKGRQGRSFMIVGRTR